MAARKPTSIAQVVVLIDTAKGEHAAHVIPVRTAEDAPAAAQRAQGILDAQLAAGKTGRLATFAVSA
jgi:hypothetical protein